ncbi:MAG: TonB-dependent siderophore receptor [Xanthomonadales bacterium]|nr:TonB-dependent siderophore receptor [Xanthomonadales bacterium]
MTNAGGVTAHRHLWPIAFLIAAGLPATAVAQVPAAPAESQPLDENTVPARGAVSAETTDLSPVSVTTTAIRPGEGYTRLSTDVATKTDTPLIRTPQTVDIVQREQINDQGSRTINDALRYTPGVFTGLSGSSTRQTVAALRGFPGGDVNNTFMNGLRLQSDPGAYSNVQIDPFFIDSIEVVKGPSSVTYGRVQPGGLINYSMKRPSRESRRHVRLYGGNYDTFGGGLDVQGALPDESLGAYRLVVGGETTSTQYDVVERQRFTIMPELSLDLSEDTNLLLYAYIQRDPEGGFHGSVPYDLSVNSSRFGRTVDDEFVDTAENFEKFDRDTDIYSYELTHRVNDQIKLTSKAQYTDLDVDFQQTYQTGFLNGATDPADPTLRRTAGEADEHLSAIALDNHAQFDFDTGVIGHTLLAGIGYQKRDTRAREAYGTATALDPFDPNYFEDEPVTSALVKGGWNARETTQLGVYLQDQLEWQGLNVVLSGRQDYLDRQIVPAGGEIASRSDDKFTWRGAVLYESKIGLSPYFAYSEGFSPGAFSADQTGNISDPVESDQYEIGVKYKPTGIDALFTVALYDLTQKNIQQRATVTNPVFVGVGDIQSRGVEFSAEGDINDKLHVIAGYSYSDVEYQQNINAQALTARKGATPARTPEQLASLWVRYDFPRHVQAGVGANYTGKSYADGTETLEVDGYTTADAMLRTDLGEWARQLDGASLQLNVNNVFNKEYVAACFSETYCYYGNARRVTAQLDYRF